MEYLFIVLIVVIIASIMVYQSSALKGMHSIHEQRIFPEEVRNILLEKMSVDVELMKAEREDVKVTLSGGVKGKDQDRFHLETNHEGEDLRIEVIEKDTRFGVGLWKNVTLQVEIPQERLGSLMVRTSSGDIDVKGVSTSHSTYESSSGDLTIQGLEHTNMKIQTSSGDVFLNRVQSNHAQISTGSGEVIGEHFDPGTGVFETSSGEISIKSKRLSGDMKASTSSGDFNFIVEEPPDSVSVDFQSNSGEVDVVLEGMDFEVRKNHEVLGKKAEGKVSVVAESSSGDLLVRGNE
ncbi:DUF4097 and DUF4098 domain-containing protein YvlB [Halobacillus dabanensis]|uniref:DUF4097 and DUF4098 domain-containing protein YvlB n=1 Tax=Halobacillus dabanensis TaxID=240302 RepID=A0A1I3TGC8_HALDA|nr:DUF4097 family beta strand repeat-containing protein [Halobacillus dabanensis]SFJ69499.1 DUF4097 and DUF4098 domain-containing protein YvlB [Halobacillus dabanensis]